MPYTPSEGTEAPCPLPTHTFFYASLSFEHSCVVINFIINW